jgi:pyruvate,water dikinase
MANEYVAWLEDLGSGDVGRVGGKNASLGEMIRNLKGHGVRVPDGFATTADAYREYIEANDIGPQLRARLDELNSGGEVPAPGGHGHPPPVPRWRVSGADPRRRRQSI